MDKSFWSDLAKSALPYLFVIVLAGGLVWIWRDSVWSSRITNAPVQTTHPPINVGPFLYTIDSLRGRLTEQAVSFKRVAGQKDAAIAFYEAELAKWRAAGSRETVMVRQAVLDTTMPVFEWNESEDGTSYGGEYVDTIKTTYLWLPIDRFTGIHLGIQKRQVPTTRIEVQIPVGVEVQPPWWKEVMVVASASALGYGAATKNWKLTTGGLAVLIVRYTI